MLQMENLSHNVFVNDIIEVLNLLLTPSDGWKSCGQPVKDPFSQHFQQNLERLNEKLSDTQFHSLSAALKERIVNSDIPGTSCEWQYVNYIVHLLHLLSKALLREDTDHSGEKTTTEAAAVKNARPKRPQDAPPLAKTTLSLNQLSTVKNALQFITSLGICPNLAPGVGIPLQHRSRLFTLAPLDAAAVADLSQSSEFNRARLSVCVSVLAELLKVQQLRSVILSTHLNDLLAVLLQLLFAMPSSEELSCKQKESQHEKTKPEASKAHNSEGNCEPLPQQSEDLKDSKSCRVSSDHAADSCPSSSKQRPCDLKEQPDPGARESTGAGDCREILECVMGSVDPVLLIRELMVLQAGVPKPVQSARNPGCAVVVPPGWLKKSCSRLLFRLAKGPQGILHLYEALSAGLDPGSPVHWKHCGTVAKIISGYPVQTQFLDQYVANISQQLTALLHAEGKEASRLTPLVGAVASAMTVKHKEKFCRHFHRPLQQPLLCCMDNREKRVDGETAVLEPDLTACLQILHRVYIQGQPPLSDILGALQPVTKVLWVLFCLTHSAVYSIKTWIKDLLVSFLRHLGRTDAAACLHDLCVGSGPSGVPLAVRFQDGGGGGLEAVFEEASSDSRLDDQQKVTAVVSVLQDLRKEGVAGELLVTLLKEMTEMISKETQQSDIVLPSSVLRSEVREEKKGELMRRVTLLHLLASICETFGSECLSDNTQILLFVKASLERGVAVCSGTSEEEMAVFETESMSMAMGLLTAVMAGALEMEEEDRKLMDDMLPLLEVIGQGHYDEFIREMVSDIRIAIATRGAVWSSLQQSKRGECGQEHKGTGKASPAQRTEKRSTEAKQVDSVHPVMDVLTDDERVPPTRPPQPHSRPLIEVLSDRPSPQAEVVRKETPSAGKTTAPQSVVEVTPSGDRSASDASSSIEKKSPSSRQTETSSPSVTGSVDAGGLNHSDQTTVCGDSAPRSQVHQDLEDADAVRLMRQGSALKAFPQRKEDSKQSPLQAVFKELCDPLLPVRGHALIALARLVEQRDPETLSQRDVVQKVFEENLHHGDSYLYLAAINGMSALSDCFPESVMPSLAGEFAGFDGSKGRLTAEHRLKVGEALMKATRNLGEMIPKYRELLLGAVLAGSRDADVTVRASSMSNLAEVCSLLRFSLGPILHEVLHCCTSLLETDEVMVRQAAALTLSKLLEGLGSDCFTALESALPGLYRLLKKVCAIDGDEAVRLHANIALDHLDKAARDFAFPKQTLQKKIRVLTDADTFNF